MGEADDGTNLIELVKRGGVFYNIAGGNPAEVLADAIATIPVPKEISRDDLLKAILEREGLMPTAVGDGIAIPHPRSPLIADPEKQLVSVCFLQRPVDWNALDGKPVRTLIILLSSSPRLHLKTLSRVSFLCRQPFFDKLLKARASREELTTAIETAEKAWA